MLWGARLGPQVFRHANQTVALTGATKWTLARASLWLSRYGARARLGMRSAQLRKLLLRFRSAASPLERYWQTLRIQREVQHSRGRYGLRIGKRRQGAESDWRCRINKVEIKLWRIS